MVRASRYVIALVLQLVGGQLAICRPPDQVVNSPIPSLKEPVSRRAAQPSAVLPAAGQIPIAISPRQSSGVQPGFVVPSQASPHDRQDDIAEQQEIWNSPPMQEARTFIVEFSRRSAQTSPAEGARFLEDLSKLPPAKMHSWLRRYVERRTKIALAREVDQLARRLMVQHALDRQEAMRQAFAHVSRLRAEAAAARQVRPEIVRSGSDEDTLTLDLRPSYDPMYPNVDPAMHLAEKILRVPIEQAAAAASLPGDLPRNDPRNYDRNAGAGGE